MSKLKRINVLEGIYFLTTRVKDGIGFKLDAQNLPVMYELMNFYMQRDKFLVYGFVFMPDHFHLVVQPATDGDCSQIMHHLKRKFSVCMGEQFGFPGPIWQARFYDHGIRDEEDLRIKIEYMHKNPLRAELVDTLEEYPYSSYRHYEFGDDVGIPIAGWPG